jgi:hypothetical protein
MTRSSLYRVSAAVLLIGSLSACGGGDPPGSAAGRATDRAMGTNMSGAFPAQSDGTAANPRGTAAERALDTSPPVRRNPSNPGL